MTHLLTCKDFLAELSDYLDETTDKDLREKLELHMQACPNCWVVCDTTRKTVKVVKGHSTCCALPAEVSERLFAAFQRKASSKV
jgi:hypothetical protein